MTKTHWKKLYNPNYLGTYALEPDQDLIVTISRVGDEKVTGADGKTEECVVAHFSEREIKPMILNSTNSKTIAKLYGPYIEDWVGKKIQVYSEKVKAFGEIVDALRIRKSIPKEKTPIQKIICESCGKEIQPMGNMDAQKLSEYTKAKYGKAVCGTCATRIAQEAAKENEADE